MSHENGGDWLTVSEAAHRWRVSERTVRRRCEAGKARCELVTTDSGPAWRVWAADIAAATPADAADAKTPPADAADVPAASTADAAAKFGEVAADTADIAADTTGAALVAIGARLDRLEGAFVGGALAQLSARLDSLPDGEAIAAQFGALRADVSKDTAALLEAATAASSHSTAEAVEIALEAQSAATAAQLVELIGPMAERLAAIEKENAALRAQLASTQQRRPWWKFWRE